MNSLQLMFEQYKANEIPLKQFLNICKQYYHSLENEVRYQIVTLLGEIDNPDASRELLLLYRTCQWRDTKLKIISTLAKHPNQRSLEFLMHLSLNTKDISLSIAAISALGQSHDQRAARFLITLFEHASEIFTPFIVVALGQVPSHSLTSEFLAMLSKAFEKNAVILIKNLILTLAELKVPEVITWCEKLLTEKSSPELVQCALLALGKVSRSPAMLAKYENLFTEDIFLQQLHQSIKNQITFRSEWKLEDYLLKIFEAAEVHPFLAFELNAFTAVDLAEGLQLFTEKKYLPRMAYALSRIEHAEIGSWYEQYLPLQQLNASEITLVLESISCHCHASMESPLLKIEKLININTDDNLFNIWLNATTLAVPQVERLLLGKDAICTYEKLSSSRKIIFINHLTNVAIAAKPQEKRFKTLVKEIEKLLKEENKLDLQIRLLRSLGQLQVHSKIALEQCELLITKNEATSSCLFYLENVPSTQSAAIILKNLNKALPPKELWAGYFKALAAQSNIEGKQEGLGNLLQQTLVASQNKDICAEALLFLSVFPLKNLCPLVKPFFTFPETHLPAILAAKAYKDEIFLQPLQESLNAISDSIVGRSIDAILNFSGIKAKNIALAFLEQHPLNLAICDKIIRSFNADGKAYPALQKIIEEIIKKHPEHPLKEGLMGLYEQMSGSSSASTDEIHKHKDLGEIDARLESQISNYFNLDKEVKAALRSAELPFVNHKIFDGPVDKANIILGYSKAIDLLLEKQLGRKHLFPKLENSLHEFQNILYSVSLNEDYPNCGRVLKTLGLEAFYPPDEFPIGKMASIARSILNGKILNEHWKSIDGLRAWGVIILLFARTFKINNREFLPLIKLSNNNDSSIIDFAHRLNALQEVRNTAAHRQTWLDFPELSKIRDECLAIFRVWNNITGQ